MLTVENTGGSTYGAAVYNNAVSFSLIHVTTAASGATWSYGVYNLNATSATMRYLTVSASNAAGSGNTYGGYNSGSSPEMSHLSITTSGGLNRYGVYNTASSSPTMTDMTCWPATATIRRPARMKAPKRGTPSGWWWKVR